MDELELYPNFHSCSPTDGKPLCNLPILLNQFGKPSVRSPQILGCSLEELKRGRRDSTPKERTYETFVVSDYPGFDADKVGLPIWGEARLVLLDLLAKAQFDPNTTYITCHAKCVPPKRKPTTGEYKECRRHFEYELNKYRPKAVILLGSESLKIFKLEGIGGITSIHGEAYVMKYPKWPEDVDFTVMAIAHPKQYLVKRQQSIRTLMQEDFVKMRGLLADGKVIDNTYYKAAFQVVETEEQLDYAINAIKVMGMFAFDTESPDLDFMRSPAIMVQISCGEGKTWIIPFYQHDPEGSVLGKFKLKPVWHNGKRDYINARLKEIFEDPNIAKVAHNLKYDANVLRRWCGIRIQGWLWDTQVMHQLLQTHAPHGLKEVADQEFSVGNWERDVNDIVGHGFNKILTYDNIPDDIFWQYAATDAELTWQLMEAYYEDMLNRPNLVKLYSEESMPLIYTLMGADYNGNHINVNNVKILGEKFDAEIENLTQLCRAETKPDFNPGSHEQVAAALRGMGFADAIEDKNAASGYSVDKDTLLEIDLPFAQNIIKYRNRKKFRTTYVDSALANLGDDGRVRYSFNQTGTIGGRLSCPFLHQIPKSKDDDIKAGNLVLRDIIDEEEGFVLYNGDYSQVELHVFAVLSGEQELMDILADPNGDIHRATAAGALLCEIHEVSDENRSAIGKPLNFGVIYGSEGHALARLDYLDPITKRLTKVGGQRALEFVRNFRQRYKKVNEFLTEIPLRARARNGKVLTIFGREVDVPDLNSQDDYKRAHAERTATNVAVQSPAGAITFRTMNLIRETLESYDIGPDKIRLVNTVHDSMAYGVHLDYIEWFDQLFREIATRPIPELGGWRLPVEAGWGQTWAEAEKNAA